jgi:hypothetical protein
MDEKKEKEKKEEEEVKWWENINVCLSLSQTDTNSISMIFLLANQPNSQPFF